MKLKVLVVDDEPLARARLVRLCARIANVEVCGEAGDGQSALDRMGALAPDVVLLDVDMPGLDGLAVAEMRRADGPAIVFTTAHAHFAVDAFDTGATDYLLKPVVLERLERALLRVSRGVENPGARAMKPDEGPGRITVQDGATLRVFDVGAIRRFRATEKYVVFLVDGVEVETRESLGALEQRLGPFGFLRVHRAELVRLDSIRTFEPDAGGGATLLLDDGQRVPVSRRSSAEVRRMLSRP